MIYKVSGSTGKPQCSTLGLVRVGLRDISRSEGTRGGGPEPREHNRDKDLRLREADIPQWPEERNLEEQTL